MLKAKNAGANLSGANLSGADLDSADLKSAYLSGDNLSAPNLLGCQSERRQLTAPIGAARLTGADMTGRQPGPSPT